MRSLAYLDPGRDRVETEGLAFANAILQRQRGRAPLEVPLWRTLVAHREYETGSWTAARANLTEAISLARDMRLGVSRHGALSALAALSAAQGRFDEVEELTGPGSAPAPGVYAVARAGARGLAALGAGRADEALAELDLSSYEAGRHERIMSRWRIADLVEATVWVGTPEVGAAALAATNPGRNAADRSPSARS
jgi:hypothetical protein